jgi:hypothetical protein
MARRVRSERDDTEWKVKRVWLPEGLRPVGPRQIVGGSVRPHQYAGLGVLLSPLFSVVFGIPALVILLPLRLARLTSWTIEAVARPWGRRGPTEAMQWRVKGWSESERALDDVADALRRGVEAPQVEGADRES